MNCSQCLYSGKRCNGTVKVLMQMPFVGGDWSRRLVATAVGVVLATEFALVALSAVAAEAGFQAIAVETSSMSPAMEAGDLAIVRPVSAAAIRPGDIIAVVEPAPNPLLVPRRVTRVTSSAGGATVT